MKKRAWLKTIWVIGLIGAASLVFGVAYYLGFAQSRTVSIWPNQKITTTFQTATDDKKINTKSAQPAGNLSDTSANQTSTNDTATSAAATDTAVTLAGTASPLLEFNKTVYDADKQNNKIIILYFFNEMSPVCKTEWLETVDAFNQLSTDQVVGFRVHFGDTLVNAEQTALAQEFGVTEGNTKVFLKNGQVPINSADVWDQAKYLLEILEALK